MCVPWTSDQRKPRYGLNYGLLPVLLSLTLTGCAGVWDEVTSRDFKVKDLFVQPDPMVVLRDSQDGDKRAKALRRLEEPRASGGSEEQQTMVLDILTTTATADKQPLCRLAAIQTLGRFQDPRAPKGLLEAFYRASTFAPDTATLIRCHAIKALGETKDPAALELLVRIVREPPAEGTETERQHALDVRLAAARALGNFQQPEALTALVSVMQKEKDIALRRCCHDSLEKATGQRLPGDPAELEKVIQQVSASGTTGSIRSAGWFNWF